MKNRRIPILVIVTLVFAVFTVGFFLGRNAGRDRVQVSLPDSMLTAPSIPDEIPQTEAPDSPAYPVNINTADLAQFMTLPDIGMVLAQRIVDYRAQHGEFQAVEELMNVEGIGEKRMEQLLDLVTIGG